MANEINRKGLVQKTRAKIDTDTYRVQDGIDGVTEGMTQSQLAAALATRSALSATTIKAYAGGDKMCISDLLVEMRRAGQEIVDGDLGRVERVLVNQALTLDSIFNSLAQKSARQEHIKQMETYLRLALKAQAQARATIESIALLKNPMPYIKQANIAQGNQQVNNTYASASGYPCEHLAQDTSTSQAGAGNLQSSPNKLLEVKHGKRLDIGTQTATGRVDKVVEAVGAVHRT